MSNFNFLANFAWVFVFFGFKLCFGGGEFILGTPNSIEEGLVFSKSSWMKYESSALKKGGVIVYQ